MSGPGRFPTDIDKVSAFRGHAQPLRHSGDTISTEPIAAEGIRRDVDDAHDIRAAAPVESVPADLRDHPAIIQPRILHT